MLAFTVPPLQISCQPILSIFPLKPIINNMIDKNQSQLSKYNNLFYLYICNNSLTLASNFYCQNCQLSITLSTSASKMCTFLSLCLITLNALPCGRSIISPYILFNKKGCFLLSRSCSLRNTNIGDSSRLISLVIQTRNWTQISTSLKEQMMLQASSYCWHKKQRVKVEIGL